MGVTIGDNEVVLKSFSSLGMQAFIITMGAVAGASVGGFLVYKLLLKYKKIR